MHAGDHALGRGCRPRRGRSATQPQWRQTERLPPVPSEQGSRGTGSRRRRVDGVAGSRDVPDAQAVSRRDPGPSLRVVMGCVRVVMGLLRGQIPAISGRLIKRAQLRRGRSFGAAEPSLSDRPLCSGGRQQARLRPTRPRRRPARPRRRRPTRPRFPTRPGRARPRGPTWTPSSEPFVFGLPSRSRGRTRGRAGTVKWDAYGRSLFGAADPGRVPSTLQPFGGSRSSLRFRSEDCPQRAARGPENAPTTRVACAHPRSRRCARRTASPCTPAGSA